MLKHVDLSLLHIMLRTLFYLSVGFYLGYRFLHPYLTDEETESGEDPVRQPPPAYNPPTPPPPSGENGSAQAQAIKNETAQADETTSTAAVNVRTEPETAQQVTVEDEDQTAEEAETTAQKIDVNATSPSNLQRIKGIGPTYAKRLVAAGIGSIALLAQSDPINVAEITKVKEWQRPGPTEWIAEAKTLVGN